jgi:hypothetical protein
MIKLIADVFTPHNGKTYSFRLDGAMSVASAKEQIAAYLFELEGSVGLSDVGKTILGDKSLGKQLANGESLYEAGVRSGHTLIWV